MKAISRYSMLVAGLLMTMTVIAAKPQDYATIRARYAPQTLSAVSGTADPHALVVGSTFEVLGVVQQVDEGDKPAYTLMVYNGKILRFSLAQPDIDVQPNVPLKVLGQVMSDGTYASLSVTRIDGEMTKRPEPAAKTPATPAPSNTRETFPAPTPAPAQSTPAPAPVPVQTTPAPSPQAPAPAPQPVKAPAPANQPKKSKPVVSSHVSVKPKTAKVAKTVRPKPVSPSKQLSAYMAMVRQANRGINPTTAGQIAYAIIKKSQRYGLDPRLVASVIRHESSFNPQAISPAGALGLGQLMPGTALQLGVTNPFDIYQNIEGTVRYLAAQLQRFNGNVAFALAAYNAGPGNVLRFGGIPPFLETRQYVQQINMHYNLLRQKIS